MHRNYFIFYEKYRPIQIFWKVISDTLAHFSINTYVNVRKYTVDIFSVLLEFSSKLLYCIWIIRHPFSSSSYQILLMKTNSVFTLNNFEQSKNQICHPKKAN